jgi:hypothetical protein
VGIATQRFQQSLLLNKGTIMKIQITPVSVYPATATQIEFLPAEVQYGVTARSQYILQNAEGQNLVSDWVAMTPEQYASWGNDDEYAINVFLTNLGLTAQPTAAEQLAEVLATQAAERAKIEAAIAEVAVKQAELDAAKAAADQAKVDADAAVAAADAAKADAQALIDAQAAADKAAAYQKAFDEAVAAAVAAQTVSVDVPVVDVPAVIDPAV